jgi:hypothetical protein
LQKKNFDVIIVKKIKITFGGHMDLEEQAVEIKHLGYNCCQAVVKTLAPLTNVDEQTLSKIGSAFGAGMGCMEGTCGAVVGAAIVAGLVRDGKGSVAYSAKV